MLREYNQEEEHEVIRQDAFDDGVEQERIKSENEKLVIAKSLLDANMPIEEVSKHLNIDLSKMQELLKTPKT